MKPLGVGIIGFGRIGAEHAAWLAKCDRARAVAVADATPARQALAATRGLKVYDRIDAMLADPDVEAVYVALSNEAHLPWTLAALQAGKAVLCEKPLGLTADEVDAMA
ncbi:MAG: Gfo/Idh/MocA family oxidoreductase, partial [Actinomycetota bacterium]|nr:Gfo/Idh/MocA family oxidoreductase [Actinomycetota bacterium]